LRPTSHFLEARSEMEVDQPLFISTLETLDFDAIPP
jgi:hypothetical protein